MEPITFTAIVAFLVYKVSGQAVSEATTDAYRALKGKLSSRFGNKSDVVKAVDMLEKKPDSEHRKGMLQEEVDLAAVDWEPEVREAAQNLLDQIEAQPQGEQHIQYAMTAFLESFGRFASLAHR